MRIFRQRAKPGFTFVEVIVGLLIVNIGIVATLTGVVYAHNILRSMEIKERAFEELRVQTEYLKGRIADGKLSSQHRAGDRQGKLVYLEGGPFKKYSIPARIYYDAIHRIDDQLPPRYRLKVWIEWQDFSSTFKIQADSLSLSVVMSEFKL